LAHFAKSAERKLESYISVRQMALIRLRLVTAFFIIKILEISICLLFVAHLQRFKIISK